MPGSPDANAPQKWIDLERYPIMQLESPAGQALVKPCEGHIDGTAGSHLPGFLLPDALECFADEARRVAPKAIRRDSSRSAYGWMNNSAFEPGHPRAWPQHDRKGTVHYALYPHD